MIKDPDTRRALRIIQEGIKRLQLNLAGTTVLTEVGSNNYKYTPIIAALAGARVNAWTADSPYGSGNEVKQQCLEVARACGVESMISISINEKPVDHVASADIITNSGFVRPLNSDLLTKAKDGLVIPLMFEAWELRGEDIDLEFCKQKGIKVAGTWENHPSIGVFDAVGPLAIKLAMEAGFEVYQNNIAVWSDDHFGEEACAAFKAAKATSVKSYTKVDDLMKDLADIDFIFICRYSEKESFFGPNGIFDIDRMLAINDSVGVVHLYGDIDNELLKARNIKVYPDRRGRSMTMTRTLAHVGLKPVLNLQIAGLKVAQEMRENSISSLSQPLTF